MSDYPYLNVGDKVYPAGAQDSGDPDLGPPGTVVRPTDDDIPAPDGGMVLVQWARDSYWEYPEHLEFAR
jgi:hypothetical protein